MPNFSQGNRRASKLSFPEVAEIRRLYAQGVITQGDLSRRFGVSVIQIGRIVRGEVWQQLPVMDRGMSEGELKESAERMLALQQSLTGAAKLEQVAKDLNKGNEMVDELIRSPLDE